MDWRGFIFTDGTVGPVADPETARRVSAAMREPIELAAEGHVSHLDDSPILLMTSSSLDWLRALVPQAQGELEFAPGIARELEAANSMRLGAYAQVVTPDVASTGDEVVLEP